MTAFRTTLLAFMMIAVSSAFAGSGGRIPTLSGTTLNGEQVQLPDDVHGSKALLIVGFTRKSSEQSTQWGVEISKMSSCAGQSVQWYELPVLTDVPRLMRPLVVRSIRSGLTPEFRSHFVPVYSSSAAWKNAVGFSAQDDAYVILMNRTGQIEHVWHGAFDQSKLSELKQVLCSNSKQALSGKMN